MGKKQVLALPKSGDNKRWQMLCQCRGCAQCHGLTDSTVRFYEPDIDREVAIDVCASCAGADYGWYGCGRPIPEGPGVESLLLF